MVKLWQNRSRDIQPGGNNFVHRLISQLLPDSKHFSLEQEFIEANAGQITLKLTSTQLPAVCPVCQQLSQRVHSRYERTLRDLNWAECPVTLAVTVRKLFCDNRGCQRRIFTERLPQLTAPWARRTHRMTQQIQGTGVALGGAAAARLMQKQGYCFSRDTILRCLARLPLPPIGALKQLGVDDLPSLNVSATARFWWI